MKDKNMLIFGGLCTLFNVIGVIMTAFVPKPADVKSLVIFLREDTSIYLLTFLTIILAIAFSCFCLFKLLKYYKYLLEDNFTNEDEYEVSNIMTILSLVFFLITLFFIIKLISYFILLLIVPAVIGIIIWGIFSYNRK